MALDTYESVWRSILLRCPQAPPLLAQSWVRETFRRIAETRRWSWLIKQGQFIMRDSIVTGTVSTTLGSQTVSGAGTAWDGSEVNRQFRVGTSYPIYTITSVNVGAQTLTIDQPWGVASQTNVTYEIYVAYVTVPTDFHSFISVWDPAYNWQLHTHVLQAELNNFDAQRANQGTAYVFSLRDYDQVSTPPLPRYEVWPHQKSLKAYPFLYETRPLDLNDAGASLPRYIRGDVLLEGSLAECALWPGPSRERPNPYFNIQLSREHSSAFMRMLFELERQDDEVDPIDLQYAGPSMPYAPLPWIDARFMQSHAL